MPPLISISTWDRVFDSEVSREPRRRVFLLMEGEHTEQWYFSELVRVLRDKKLPRTLDINPVRRTENHEHQSAPEMLYSQAIEIKTAGALDGYEKGDEICIIFDADVYARTGKAEAYSELLKNCEDQNIEVAVTAPDFELFLLLHKENAYETIIKPHEKLILSNAKVDCNLRKNKKADVLPINW